MTYYAARGAVLDRFLAEHDVDPDDVLSADLRVNYDAGIDIRIHTYHRIAGLNYQPDYPHERADVEREDLTICIDYVPSAGKEVAA